MRKAKKELIKKIKELLKWYNETPEHDNDFNVGFKEEASDLLCEAVKMLEED